MPNFIRIVPGMRPLGANLYQKFQILTISRDLSLHFYNYNVGLNLIEIGRKLVEIPQPHTISKESISKVRHHTNPQHKNLSCCKETARCFMSLSLFQRHSRSFEMTPFSRTSPYQYFIVTMFVSRTVFEIFNVNA